MEGEMKEIIHEKEYVHDNRGWCDDGYYYGRRRGVDNSARALGIVGTVAGGLALLGGMANGRLWGGNYGTPENVNINNVGLGGTGVAPTAFQAWEKNVKTRWL